MPVTDPGFTITEFIGLLCASVIGGLLTGGVLIRVYLWCTKQKGCNQGEVRRRRLVRKVDDSDDDEGRPIVALRQSASTLPIQNPPPEEAQLSGAGTVKGEKDPIISHDGRLYINQNAESPPPKLEYLPPIDLGSTFASEGWEAPAVTATLQAASHFPDISGSPRSVRLAPLSQGESREERRARAFRAGEASTVRPLWGGWATNDAVSPLPLYNDTVAALRPPHYTRGPIHPGSFPSAGIGRGNPVDRLPNLPTKQQIVEHRR